MNLYNDLQELGSKLKDKKLAITIGNFDGVHSGHRHLLKNFVSFSLKRNLIPLVFTFSPHPLSFITGKENHKISTDYQNYEELSNLGIRDICVLDFNEQLKNKSGSHFLNDIFKAISVKGMYLGYDFSLGANKEYTDTELLGEYGDKLEIIIEEQFFKDNKKISSSIIRDELSKGNISYVNELLERPYTICGEIIVGNKIGTTLGYPTANIEYDQSLHVPKSGVYFSRAVIDGFSYPAAINIGKRPSVTSDEHITIEAHILGLRDDIYGKQLELNFISHIRDEIKFNNHEELKQQIAKDILEITYKPFEITMALVGKNIKHSLSPMIYSKLLKGFPINYSLLNFEDESEVGKLEGILNNFSLVSVTSPYKKYCYENSLNDCENIKAVNTLRMKNDQVVAENTDYQASQDILKNFINDGTKTIYILGDGAMSRVIKYALDKIEFKYTQFSRNQNNLHNIHAEINKIPEQSSLLVINSCSREYTFPKLNKGHFKFWDLNYAMPKHLKLFHGTDVKYIDGIELLELQAKYALSFWNCKTS